jgi:phosphohistidine phosphatase
MVMELYLIRHADAQAAGENGISEDAQRPLTPIGVQQSATLAHTLHEHLVGFDQVLTSPLVRARQTAELLVQNWPGQAPPLQVCEDLAPGGKRRKLSRFLRNLGGDTVALVGHMPDLAVLASWLIGSKKAQIDFAKAGVACIHVDGKPAKGHGVLISLLSPQWYGNNHKPETD